MQQSCGCRAILFDQVLGIGRQLPETLHLVEPASGQDGVLWRLYPKHHMFWHLLHAVAPRDGPPRDYWNWRDESFGGQLALVAKRRGGKAIPAHGVAALGWVGA